VEDSYLNIFHHRDTEGPEKRFFLLPLRRAAKEKHSALQERRATTFKVKRFAVFFTLGNKYNKLIYPPELMPEGPGVL